MNLPTSRELIHVHGDYIWPYDYPFDVSGVALFIQNKDATPVTFALGDSDTGATGTWDDLPFSTTAASGLLQMTLVGHARVAILTTSARKYVGIEVATGTAMPGTPAEATGNVWITRVQYPEHPREGIVGS